MELEIIKCKCGETKDLIVWEGVPLCEDCFVDLAEEARLMTEPEGDEE